MRLVPLKEVLALGASETVPSVRGRVTFVDKVIQSKPDADKPWAFQKVKLIDNGTEVACKFWNRDPFDQTVKGKVMVITCGTNQKNGKPIGIETQDDTYREQTSRILKVSEKATVEYEGEVAPASAPEQQQQSTPPPQTASAPAANGNAPAATNGNGHTNGNGAANGTVKGPAKPLTETGDIKKCLNRMANLYLHCMAAAEYVQEQWDASKDRHGSDRVMSQEKFDACAGSLFIESCKGGLVGITPTGVFNEKH